MLGILFAILSALFWALTNFVDKYVVDKHMKNFWGFMPVAGVLNILIGIILFMFYPTQINTGFIWAAVAGITLGICAYLYYYLLQFDDASFIVGLNYSYPVIVLLAGVFLLGERVSIIFLVGLALLLSGTIIGMVRLHSIKKRLVFILICSIFFSAAQEVFSKVASNSIQFMQATVVFSIFLGITQITSLLKKESRNYVKEHFVAIPYIIFSEIFTTTAILFAFISLSLIPVSLFSAISIIQIVFILLFERIYSIFYPKVEIKLYHKYFSLSLICVGFLLIVLS